MTNDIERDLRETLVRKSAEPRAWPTAPPDVLRRARRRKVRTVLAAGFAALILIAGSVAGTQALLDHGSANRLGGNGDTTLPTVGPAPGQTSLLLASGENAGEPWALRVTSDPASGFGLDFGYDHTGGGGGGLVRMGDKPFMDMGGSSSASYPNHDPTSPALPNGVSGEVTPEAARVEFQLQNGPAIEANLYPLPEDLVGPAQAFLLFVPGDALVQAGDLVAYDAASNEIGREYLDLSPLSLFPKVLEESSPEAVKVMYELQLAGAVAGRYFDTHGSFSGFDPNTASAISPDVTYNTSATAIAGQVSLRVSGPQQLVLASMTSDGQIYSACFTNGPVVDLYGRNDTSDPYACTNGWLDPSGSPVTSGDTVIASGEDPVGGLWTLLVMRASNETDLEFQMATLVMDKPLAPLGGKDLGDVAISEQPQPGTQPSLPTPVYGLASARVASVELQTVGGDVLQGELHPVPSDVADAAQAFFFLVPVDGPLTGTLIAYDASGNELQREPVTNDRSSS